VTFRGTVTRTLFGLLLLGLGASSASAQQASPSTGVQLPPTSSFIVDLPNVQPQSNPFILDLGFTLSDIGLDKNSISFTKRGLLVPTPWGGFEATIVSTPVDRMVRVPLSPNTDANQSRFQPYVTAGTRKSVDEDSALEASRAISYGSDLGRGASLKGGAGVLLKLDDRGELFGEYQFMRLGRDGGSAAGGPSLDSTGFSLGLSIRY
jgi:hypothetical protein